MGQCLHGPAWVLLVLHTHDVGRTLSVATGNPLSVATSNFRIACFDSKTDCKNILYAFCVHLPCVLWPRSLRTFSRTFWLKYFAGVSAVMPVCPGGTGSHGVYPFNDQLGLQLKAA